MKVVSGKQIGPPFFQPLGSGKGLALWAMPVPARVVCVPFVPALITSFQMTAERSSTAGFDGTQHTLLRGRQGRSVRLAKLLAMGAHDIGDFEGGPHWENQRGLGLGGSGWKA